MLVFKAMIWSLFMVMASSSYAASFNCGLAKTQTEKAICNNVELSALDDQLAISYKKALNTHPFPNYVKNRQREWLRENSTLCSGKNVVSCLKNRYIDRLDQLQGRNLAVYSNTNNFSYPSTDMVVEVWQTNYGHWRLSAWGGFVIHRLASQEQGKDVYTGCEFDGIFKTKTSTAATSLDNYGLVVNFFWDAQNFTFSRQPEICSGFGSMPSLSFRRVTR